MPVKVLCWSRVVGRFRWHAILHANTTACGVEYSKNAAMETHLPGGVPGHACIECMTFLEHRGGFA